MVGAVGKISAFRQFNILAMPRFEYLCDLLFHLSYRNSAFLPSGVGKRVPASAGN